MSVAVVAIGGNSLVLDQETGTIPEQFKNARNTCKHLSQIIQEGWDLVLSHGNGPQVGAMLRRSELAAPQIYELPLGVCDANTAGGIGYMLQQVLGNQFSYDGIDKKVVAMVTQVQVSTQDPELSNPSKPIGQFLSKEDAQLKIEELGWTMVEDSGRGWRRVVASPKPKKIIEIDAIKALLQSGHVPIAAGGGGVPVVKRGKLLDGLDAVIDKDRTAGLLATQLKADLFIISTGVAYVEVGFHTNNAQKLREIRAPKLRELYDSGEFPKGSMGPKIEAALDFIEQGGKRVLITDPEHLSDGLKGKAGTQILP
ncbi:MAG: carbamate kinase [Myxococcota bacterium]|nr:carbamate kinase [Myxococcota bacterium]